MSLPISETTPDDFNELPPAQKRRIRQSIKNANLTELRSFIAAMKERSTPSFDYLLFTLLSAVIVVFAILFDSPLLLVVAAVSAPFLAPLIGVAISPAIPSFLHFFRSLLSLLISIVIYLLAGALAGFLAKSFNLASLNIIPRLFSAVWLEWLVLIQTASLTAILVIKRDENPRTVSAILSYLIFIPTSFSAYFYTTDQLNYWAPLSWACLVKLFITLLIITLVFILFGLKPLRAIGWSMVIGLILASILLLLFYLPNQKLPGADFAIETTPTLAVTMTSPPTKAKQDTEVRATQTFTPVPTNTPKPTLTHTHTITPTPMTGIVNSQSGAVIRSEPDFTAPVVSYANNGSEILLLNETKVDGQYIWISVMTESGEKGWMLSTLIQTATPLP